MNNLRTFTLIFAVLAVIEAVTFVDARDTFAVAALELVEVASLQVGTLEFVSLVFAVNDGIANTVIWDTLSIIALELIWGAQLVNASIR